MLIAGELNIRGWQNRVAYIFGCLLFIAMNIMAMAVSLLDFLEMCFLQHLQHACCM